MSLGAQARTIFVSKGALGNSTNSLLRSTSGVLISTVPSTPNSELAEISLPSVRRSLCASPKISAALMLILPPFPRSALAIISLPSPLLSGEAIINSVLIVKLPPLACLDARAETELLFSKIRLSAI